VRTPKNPGKKKIKQKNNGMEKIEKK